MPEGYIKAHTVYLDVDGLHNVTKDSRPHYVKGYVRNITFSSLNDEVTFLLIDFAMNRYYVKVAYPSKLVKRLLLSLPRLNPNKTVTLTFEGFMQGVDVVIPISDSTIEGMNEGSMLEYFQELIDEYMIKVISRMVKK